MKTIIQDGDFKIYLGVYPNSSFPAKLETSDKSILLTKREIETLVKELLVALVEIECTT